MKKESFVLTLFRLSCRLALVIVLCLLYWSTSLLEEGNRRMLSEMSQLHNDIGSLKTQLSESTLKVTISPPQAFQEQETHSSLPNLLKEDLFYEKTLPKLLGKDFKPHGNLQNATMGKPDNLHPFSNWAQVSQWINLCTSSIATSEFGKYETLAPDMAVKMEERKNEKTQQPEYWLYLRKGVYWQPLKPSFFSDQVTLAPQFLKKHPVTAHDFKFWFDAAMNPYNQEPGAVALRTYLMDIEEVDVIDDYTLLVRWKTHEVTFNGKTSLRAKYIAKSWTGALKPLASHIYKYFSDGKKILEDDSDKNAYRTSSLWAQNFSQHWAKNVIPSCGPWVFGGMTDRQISFKRNSDYYYPLAALADTMTIEFKDTPDAIWQSFKAGKVDSYNIQPNQLLELKDYFKTPMYETQVKEGLAIKQLDYLAPQFAYIGWNQAKPFFKSKKVRQALTMAIDRKRIIRDYLNGKAIETTGMFSRSSPSYDASITPHPFDLYQARQMLEEEGWYDSDGDGIIDKEIDGQRVKFKFQLMYYVQDHVRKSICEYVATALKEVGIICQLNGVDIADLTAAFDDKNFDALSLNWATATPPEDPRQLFYSSEAKEKGSSNAFGFANPEVDAVIDQLQYEYDPEKRKALYYRFDQILYEEQPYTFLFIPQANFIYREYLQNVFLPSERQDLVPGADVAQPESSIFWIKHHKESP